MNDTVFPTNWKLPCVKPFLKKGAPTDLSNFRSISLLSIPGKILEDIISDSIDNHIEAQDLLSDNQWGFRENHSTEGLLLHLRPRPHVSGYFWIRNFFFPDTANIHTDIRRICKQMRKFLNPLSRVEMFESDNISDTCGRSNPDIFWKYHLAVSV